MPADALSLRTPPGPPPRKGTLGSLRYYRSMFNDPIGFVQQRFEQYGDIYYAPSNGVGLYVLRHPDHLHELLVKNAACFGKSHSGLTRLERVLGRALLTSDGDEWRRQRRLVNPAFSSKRIAGYAEAMTDEARRWVDGWADRQVRDVSREMMELTLSIVSRTLFSHDVRSDTDVVAHAMNLVRQALAVPDLTPSWLPTPMKRREERALGALDELIYGLVHERQRDTATRADPPDLLQMLVDARDDEGDGGGLSDREVRDQLVTLFLAGHETTSHALTWTWYLLSENPTAERKLHDELADVLGGRAARYDDLPQLPYTRQVFEESMRLFPPAYSVARRALKDTELGGYPVPAGAEAVGWIYMTHHDPRWYPDPELFRPERFAADDMAKRPKLSYLPFGAGARACIGKMFAMIEAQLVLATVAQRYRLELVAGHPVALEPRVTLSPKHGMRMVLHAR